MPSFFSSFLAAGFSAGSFETTGLGSVAFFSSFAAVGLIVVEDGFAEVLALAPAVADFATT